jgi:hypothetical protein
MISTKKQFHLLGENQRQPSPSLTNQTLWNLVGISYAMWSCARKGWFFQNGCRCHGNGQNAKKLKKHKNDHCEVGSEFNIVCTLVPMATTTILDLFTTPTADTHYSGYSYKVSWSLMKGIQNYLKCYSPNKNLWNLIGITSTASGTR